MRQLVQLIMTCRRGATAVEYGLILALVVIVMVVSLKVLAGVTIGMWDGVATKVATAK